MKAVARNSVEHVTPLVVDLDGTLIKSDLLFEVVFRRAGRDAAAVLPLLSGLLKSKAHFKDMLTWESQVDPAYLLYDDAVLDLIHEARALGRPVYLASASHRSYVSAIAAHLGLFTGWFGSGAATNVSGPKKARLLAEMFGDRGFDYIGNDRADIPVWAAASKRIGVQTPSGIAKKLSAIGFDVIEYPKLALAAWLKLFRVHQYARNALVILPLLKAHQSD